MHSTYTFCKNEVKMKNTELMLNTACYRKYSRKTIVNNEYCLLFNNILQQWMTKFT